MDKSLSEDFSSAWSTASKEFVGSLKNIGGIGKATFGTLKESSKGFLTTFLKNLHPLNKFTLAIGAASLAVSALVFIADKIKISSKEAKEALGETQSKLDEVTSKYENNLERIKELESLEAPSITDKEDLERLKAENEELRIRQKYLETDINDKKKQVVESTKSEFDSKYGNASNMKEARQHLKTTGNNDSVEYYKALEDYEKYKKKKDEAIANEDAKGIEKWNKKLEEAESKLIETRTEVQGFYDDLRNNGASEEELSPVITILRAIDNLLLSTSERISSFIDTNVIESDRDKLVELASSGELTTDILAKEFPDVNKYIIENGISIDDLISYLKTLQGELVETGKKAEENLSFVDRMSKVENMATGFDMLDEIYADVKDGKEFDYTSILNNEGFNEAFGDYKEEYDNFIKTITNSPKDIKACQDAFNDLATAYIWNQDALENITEETKNATILWLKQKGVVNAEEVAEAALAKTKDKLIAKEEALNIAKKKNIDVAEDLEDATYEEISALYNAANALAAEGAASEDTRQYLANLALSKINLNNVKISTKSDIDQIIALANASGDATGYVNALKQALNNLQNKSATLNKYRNSSGNIAYMNTDWQMFAAVNKDKLDDIVKEEVDAQKEFEKAFAEVQKNALNAADYQVDVKYDYKDPSSSGSGSGSDTEESFDWIQVKIERLEREIENLDQIVNATYKSWTDRNKSLADEISKVTEEIAVQDAGYKKYMSLADSVGLSEPYKTLVKNGAIDYTTLKDEKLIDKINKYKEFYELALACEDATKDLRDELAALAKTSFDNVVTQYEERFSLIEHEASVLEAYINQVETKGHVVSKSYYEELMKVEKNNLATLRAEYSSLQSALEKAMADGSIVEGSSDWYDMVGSINDVETAIIESNTALIEFQKNIRDLEWENFDRLEEMISQVTDEADFLIDLMSDEDLFDEKGKVSDQGEATFGLHAVKYNTYMEQSKDYADEIEEINKDLAKDPYNIELLERREELIQSQRDMILAAEDEKQAMIDLAEEGYNKMLDYLDELIDKRKEALQAEKDLYDYEKTVREQAEEIARLEKIGQALDGDTSEEGRLRAQQNATALEEAKEALQETEYDKYLSDQEQMLDTLASEAEQWVSERLENRDQLLRDIISATNENSGTIKTTLETETRDVGIKLSGEMSSIWGEGGVANKVVSTYSQGISDNVTGVISVLERIESFVATMVKTSDEEAKEDINGTSNNSPTHGSSGSNSSGTGSSGATVNSSSSSSSSTSNKTNTSTDSSKSPSSKWGSWFESKKNNISKSKLNKDTSIVDRLKYLDYDSSFTAREKYYSAMGGSGTYTGSAKQNSWMISEMKKHSGFSTGGLIGSAIKATGEDGFILAKAGEYVLTAEQFEKLGQALTAAQPLMDSINKLPKIDLNSMGNTITNEIEMNIAMHGVQDVQGLVSELQKNNRFQKIVEQMTIGKISGANGLSKYKY